MIIVLTKGYTTEIDDEDCNLVGRYKWCVHELPKKQYAVTSIDGKLQYMHRLLMGNPEGKRVDHKDGNGLNNKRINLRVATGSQNSANAKPKTCKYKGVHRHKSGRYYTQICFRGIKKTVGTFKTPEEAALCYDRLARLAFGEFANTNFPL